MASASEAGALLSAALLLGGCAAKKAVVFSESGDGGVSPFVMVKRTELPPGKRKDLPPDPPEEIAVRRAVWVSSASGERLTLPPPSPKEEPLKRAAGEALRPEASTGPAAGGAGPPPVAARVQGQPEVERPDELTPLPTGRPGHYVSPAALDKQDELSPPKDRGPGGTAPADEEPVLDLSASPSAFRPAETARLEDEVPDTGVDAPTEIGSYHLQIAATPAFAPVFFDQVYPFMADIDLRSDLLAKKTRPGIYWIRYALVDLLGFEHPYSKPRRVLLR